MEKFITNKNAAQKKLVDGAEELFAAFGYDGTSVRMIAKHVRTNPAMIDYYFGSKQNLYDQIFNLRLEVLNESIKKIETINTAENEKISLFFATYLESVERNKNFHKLLLREMYLADNNSPTKNFIISSMRHHFELLKSIVDAGKKKKIFNNINSGLFSLNVLLMAPMLTVENHFKDVLGSCEKKLLNTSGLTNNLHNYFRTMLLNLAQPVY